MATPARCMMGRRLRLMDDDGSGFVAGAALVLAAGVLDEAAATPITIVGFAAEDEDPTDALGDTLAVDVHPGQTLVQVAHPGATFLMELHNTAVQVAPDTANIGVQYGIIKAANGAWAVEETDVLTPCVTVVGIAEQVENSPQLALVEVEVIDPILFSA